MIVSKKEFAERHGVKAETVRSWILRGHIRPPALRQNGGINVELADRMLAISLDGVKQASSGRRASPTVPAAPSPAELVDLSVSRQLLQARATIASVQAEKARLALNYERGQYMRTTSAEAAWSRVLGDFILAVENSFPELVDQLADRQKPPLITIRRWWRALRIREAERNAQQALAAPEHEADEQ